MRARAVKKTRDLRTVQQRVTVQLECGHIISISERQIRMMDTQDLIAVLDGTAQVMCHHCPDASVEEVREEASPSRLWKEAGEP